MVWTALKIATMVLMVSQNDDDDDQYVAGDELQEISNHGQDNGDVDKVRLRVRLVGNTSDC